MVAATLAFLYDRCYEKTHWLGVALCGGQRNGTGDFRRVLLRSHDALRLLPRWRPPNRTLHLRLLLPCKHMRPHFSLLQYSNMLFLPSYKWYIYCSGYYQIHIHIQNLFGGILCRTKTNLMIWRKNTKMK